MRARMALCLPRSRAGSVRLLTAIALATVSGLIALSGAPRPAVAQSRGESSAHLVVPGHPIGLVIARYSGSPVVLTRTVHIRDLRQVGVARILEGMHRLPTDYGAFCPLYHANWHDVLTFLYRARRKWIVTSQTECPPVVFLHDLARGPKYGGLRQHSLLVKELNALFAK